MKDLLKHPELVQGEPFESTLKKWLQDQLVEEAAVRVFNVVNYVLDTERSNVFSNVEAFEDAPVIEFVVDESDEDTPSELKESYLMKYQITIDDDLEIVNKSLNYVCLKYPLRLITTNNII